MPRYSLIAARDGDLITEVSEHPDQTSAEDWAWRCVETSFELGWANCANLEEISAETDGLELTELDPDPVGEAAINMLRASFRMIPRWAKDPELWRDEHTREFVLSASQLSDALDSQGYATEHGR